MHGNGEKMTKAYWVARVDVDDLEGYKSYVAANAEAFSKYGGKFLVRAGKFETGDEARGRGVRGDVDEASDAVRRRGGGAGAREDGGEGAARGRGRLERGIQRGVSDDAAGFDGRGARVGTHGVVRKRKVSGERSVL